MSLLMDALKRAPASPDPPQPSDDLKLEPLEEPAPASPPPGLPNLAQHLEALNADLAASLSPPPPREQQAQAREAFAARVPTPAPTPNRRPLWIAIAGLVLLLALAGYFVWQWQALNQPAPPRPAPVTPAPMVQAPIQITPSLEPSPPRESVSPQDISRSMNNQRLSHESLGNPPPATAPELPTLRIQRSSPPLDPNLQQGHKALEQGALPQARQDFERALQRDPHNLDALLSLAAIALKEGRQPVALQLYQAALTAHPRDARALAGYLSLNSPRDPEGTESRLKTLLQEQADAPALHFALGNLLANQGRWHEAQAAYFQAYSLDSSNPDYRFNLAVSLDQLRQGKPAADYYRQALEAAQHRPAAFDPAQVRTRLQILEGSAAP